MSSPVSELVRELPKSTIPAGNAIDGGQYRFYVSGPTPLWCDEACHDGEALVLSTGGNAAVHFGRGRFSYSTDCWALEPIDQIVDGKFLYYYLYSQIDRIDALGFEGSGLRHLRKNFIRKYPVREFPRREQTMIAEVLSTVDRAIEETEALIAKRQRVKMGLMQDLLTRGIPGRHDRFKQTKVGEIPETWSTSTYGELAAPVPRSIQSGPFGSSLRHSEFQEEGVLVVGIDNTQDGYFSMGSQNRISEEKFRQLSKFEVRPLDLLIVVMGASVGRCCVAPQDIEKSILTKHVYRLTVDNTRADSYFLLACLLGHQSVKNDVLKNVHGLSRPGLNKTLLLPITFPLPQLDEQKQIVEILTSQQNSITNGQHRRDKMLMLRAGLMRDLLSGDVPVTPLMSELQETIT